MPHCESCGEWVSTDFARVFGDEDGTVDACLNCETQVRIRDGAAHPDGEPDIPRTQYAASPRYTRRNV